MQPAFRRNTAERMLLARNEPGDQEEAEPLITEALTICEKLGMMVAAASAKALAADLARN